MSFVTNMPEQQEASVLDYGNYRAMVTEAELGETSKGGDKINLKYEILTGEKEQSTGIDPTGWEIRDTLIAPDPGHKDGGKFCHQRVFRFKNAFGIDQQDEIDVNDLIGKEVTLLIGVGKDNEGYPENIIKGYPLTAG